MKRYLIAVVTCLLAVGPLSASAIMLQDSKYPFVYLNGSDGSTSNDRHTVTHDLSAYIPGSYVATSGYLSLAFADDAGCYFSFSFYSSCSDSGEYAVIKLDFSLFATHEVDGSIWSYDWEYYGLTGTALASLNEDGKLSVTVKARSGDFWWKKSILTVYADPVSVPEPGTIMLLGSGLLAVAFASRRRRRQSI